MRMLEKAHAKDDKKHMHTKNGKSAPFQRKASFWLILGAFGCLLESRKAIKEEVAFFVETRDADRDCAKEKKKAHRSRQYKGEDKIKISERE